MLEQSVTSQIVKPRNNLKWIGSTSLLSNSNVPHRPNKPSCFPYAKEVVKETCKSLLALILDQRILQHMLITKIAGSEILRIATRISLIFSVFASISVQSRWRMNITANPAPEVIVEVAFSTC
jgi:hypothetical protein